MGTSLTTTIEPQPRTIDGLRFRYAEGDSGPDEPTILLTSPWPESVYGHFVREETPAEYASIVLDAMTS
jgi:hypothetical protein